MSSSKNLDFKKTGFLSKTNSAFIEQMYLQYINQDPSLPDSWKDYFDEIGDEVDIIGMGAEKLKSTITGIEMFRKILDKGEAGDNAGILLRGIEKTDISRGMVICKPGSVTPHSKFKAGVYILKKEEGGRHTPFHNNYRPQFYVRTTDVTGNIVLPDGVEMVMPGDNLTIEVELISPIALNVGLRFAIREGGRTVGAGQVTELLD